MQRLALGKFQNIWVIDVRRVRQRAEGRENLLPAREAPASDLANHESMGPNFLIFEPRAQMSIAAPQVIDPHGGIDEHDGPLAPGAAPAPRNGFHRWLAAPERCEAPGALASNKCSKALAYHGGLFLESAQLAGSFEEVVIDNKSRTHMH